MVESSPARIELAPQHGTGLQIASPVMVSAGCYGLGTEYRGLVELDLLGAIVVGPVTMRARRGTGPPRNLPVTGGVLLHTGLANPGLPATLKRHTRAWAGSPVPVILHIAATTPEETVTACERVDGVAAVTAIELGLASHISPSEATALVSAAAESYRNGPLMVRLPLENAAELARHVVKGGAHTLTIGAPPRGTAQYRGQWITGRLYGPFVLPLALRALREVVERVKVPLIACGGVYEHAGAMTFLEAGASAIQIDAALWKDPSTPMRIAQSIARSSTEGAIPSPEPPTS